MTHSQEHARLPPFTAECRTSGILTHVTSLPSAYSEAVLAKFGKARVNVDFLAAQLQAAGAKSFVKSWNELLGVIASEGSALKMAA